MSDVRPEKDHLAFSLVMETDPENKFPYKIFWFWFLSAIFYTYQWILKAFPGVVANELIVDFGISATSLGTLTGLYFLSYSVLQIPIGLILDRFGVRKLIGISVSLCAIGAWLFSVSSDFNIVLVSRFLVGMGASGAFIGTIKVITMWFPEKLIPVFTGLTVLMGSIGGVLVNKPLSWLLQTCTWREVMFGLSIFGAILSVLCMLFLRNNEKSSAQITNFEDLKAGLRQVVQSRQILLIAIFALFIYLPLSVLADQWGNLFLQTCYHFSREEASSCIQMSYFGIAIGGPAFGIVAATYTNYRIIFRLVTVVQIPILASIIWLHLPSIEILQIFLFLLGLSLGGQALKFNAAFAHASPSSSGSIVGFVNTICMLGGYFVPQLIGFLLDFCWEGALQDGRKIYSEAAYAKAFSVFMIALGICFFLTYYIKNKQQESDDDL